MFNVTSAAVRGGRATAFFCAWSSCRPSRLPQSERSRARTPTACMVWEVSPGRPSKSATKRHQWIWSEGSVKMCIRDRPRVAVERMREIKRDRRAKPSDWIMGDELGVDVHPDRYARRLRAFCKKNGLPHVAPKYFRHTFRVNTRKADIPEQDIQLSLIHI